MVAPTKAKDNRLVERIADAVLYEGYILYPYRPSAVKNQQRWNFGVLFPESYSVAQDGTETSTMRTECLVEIDSLSKLEVKIRFLHLSMREVGETIGDCRLPVADCGHVVGDTPDHFGLVRSLELNGKVFQAWQEAVEREVVIPDIKLISLSTTTQRFAFPANRTTEPLIDDTTGSVAGLIVRTQQSISGEIEISATILNSDSPEDAANQQLIRLSVVIRNLTPFEHDVAKRRDDALLHSFVSTHTILGVSDGEFVSLLDPPESFKAAAAECANTGTYPVLVGDEGDRQCILSSPIILYDYPQIAPESTGDLFDGTEIDEILTLRIMSLTDEEKREMRSADVLARQLLERTESLSADQMVKLHGVMKKAT